jgi:hypothetical protein
MYEWWSVPITCVYGARMQSKAGVVLFFVAAAAVRTNLRMDARLAVGAASGGFAAPSGARSKLQSKHCC